ncbi:MAG: phosphotransferase family protein, partial [Variovorax sp.]
LSTLGHPLADFAYHAMMYRMPPDILGGIKGVDLAASQLPDEAAYVRAYCERTGRDGIGDMDFYVAFNMFRFAAILHGIRGRVLRGTASSAEAVALSSKFERVAELAWEQAQRAR